MAKQEFIDSISGHLPTDPISQERIPRIKSMIMNIIDII